MGRQIAARGSTSSRFLCQHQSKEGRYDSLREGNVHTRAPCHKLNTKFEFLARRLTCSAGPGQAAMSALQHNNERCKPLQNSDPAHREGVMSGVQGQGGGTPEERCSERSCHAPGSECLKPLTVEICFKGLGPAVSDTAVEYRWVTR